MFELFGTDGKHQNLQQAKKVREAEMCNELAKPCQMVGFTVLDTDMFFVSGSNLVFHTTAEQLSTVTTRLPGANDGGHQASVHALCVDQEAALMFSGGHDHDIKVWKMVWCQGGIVGGLQ
jgi:hypothetical protein